MTKYNLVLEVTGVISSVVTDSRKRNTDPPPKGMLINVTLPGEHAE